MDRVSSEDRFSAKNVVIPDEYALNRRPSWHRKVHPPKAK
jgi:hypothetical protein